MATASLKRWQWHWVAWRLVQRYNTVLPQYPEHTLAYWRSRVTQQIITLSEEVSAITQVRARCVAQAQRLQQDEALPHGIQQRIANLYAPDLSSGWGIECVQVRS